MKQQEIIVANQLAFEKIMSLMNGLDLFNKCTIVNHFRTYPHSSNPKDNHITMIVQGLEKEIHAVRVLAWLSYKKGFDTLWDE